MRFATIRTPDGITAARLDGDVLVPLAAADVGALLADGGGPAAAERAGAAPVPASEARFATLIPQPSKVLCVGLNYRSHILETGRDLPQYPTLFAKFAQTLLGAHDDLVLPSVSDRVDWEVELGVVIGRPIYRATRDEAAAAALVISIGLAAPAAPRALAENNGLAASAPLMGWSSWSFLRSDPTAAKIEAEASALKSSGLSAHGYDYVNLDDFWYQCPGSQGPNVDQYGRWVTDAAKFPGSGSTSGIGVVANYVHSLGLKFGLYVTPGISKQAVAQNTPIQGTSYTADQIGRASCRERV